MSFAEFIPARGHKFGSQVHLLHGLYPRALACVNNMSPIAPEHPKRLWYFLPFGAMKTRSVRSRGAQALALAVALAGARSRRARACRRSHGLTGTQGTHVRSLGGAFAGRSRACGRSLGEVAWSGAFSGPREHAAHAGGACACALPPQAGSALAFTFMLMVTTAGER